MRILAVGTAALTTAAVLWFHGRAVAVDLATARDLHGTPHAGSSACRRCHPDHDRSWRLTSHRTMNQPATPATVKGPFDGSTVRYGGVTARMDRDAEGRYRMTFVPDGGAPSRSVIVERTVGSRRYQQYLTRADDGQTFLRLPVAYHVQEGRWFHMNGAFLTPDPPEPAPGQAIAAADYDRHVTRWNDNCIFCHNTGANPGRDQTTGAFASRVEELGIACEACHGPGEEHARVNADPVRRYALHAGLAGPADAGHAAGAGGGDPTVINPLRLSPARAADVCGRCHGQRITDDVGAFLARGDPFVPGDDLAMYSAPLWRGTTLRGEPEVFAPRFWDDGTPRLTAYEYQGLLQSPCAQAPAAGMRALTCTDCHSMHDSEPAGQIARSSEGNAACTGCHRAFADAAAVRAHARHDPAGAGARCVDCHMPRIVYGVLDVHRSHRIEIPEPARDEARGRPDACTACHVDRTRAWAIGERTRLWTQEGTGFTVAAAPAAAAAAAGTEAQGNMAPGPRRWALAGDPVMRAVAVDAMGRAGAPATPGEIARRLGLLVDVMEADDYPAVRRIAARALGRLLARHHPQVAFDLRTYRPTGPAAPRLAAVAAVVEALPAGAVVRPAPGDVNALRGEARLVAIDIGE